MSRADGGGVSRRRILQGAVWTAPVIVLATSAPARAASEVDGGLRFVDFGAIWVASFWDADAQQSLPAVIGNANVQNQPTVGGGTSPDVVEFTISYTLPVGSISSPRWGLGHNSEGIADPATWSLASGPTVNGGVATISFTYHGAPLATWGNTQPTCWLETLGPQIGLPANCTVAAVHTGGTTSSDARGSTTVAGSAEVLPILDEGPIDWVYTPQPPPP